MVTKTTDRRPTCPSRIEAAVHCATRPPRGSTLLLLRANLVQIAAPVAATRRRPPQETRGRRHRAGDARPRAGEGGLGRRGKRRAWQSTRRRTARRKACRRERPWSRNPRRRDPRRRDRPTTFRRARTRVWRKARRQRARWTTKSPRRQAGRPRSTTNRRAPRKVWRHVARQERPQLASCHNARNETWIRRVDCSGCRG